MIYFARSHLGPRVADARHARCLAAASADSSRLTHTTGVTQRKL